MEIYGLELLKHDLIIRGYSSEEIDELLNIPIVFIPGPLTPQDVELPKQKLTDQLVTVYKDVQKKGIDTRVAVAKNLERIYVEEHHASIDLGTICIAVGD